MTFLPALALVFVHGHRKAEHGVALVAPVDESRRQVDVKAACTKAQSR